MYDTGNILPLYESPATTLKNSDEVKGVQSFINTIAQKAAEDKLNLIASERVGSSWMSVRKTTCAEIHCVFLYTFAS